MGSVPPAGTYALGPQQAVLRVRTGTGGPAARTGHALVIEVGAWSATLQIGGSGSGGSSPDPAVVSVELSADARSLRVIEGSGGAKPLGDGDMATINERIDGEILRGGTIGFRSSRVRTSGDEPLLHVHGELELLGTRRPMTFSLGLGEGGQLRGRATVTQSEFGIKPYSALFGTLKVLDQVEIELDGRLPVG